MERRALILLLCLPLAGCPKNDDIKECSTIPVVVEVPVEVRRPNPPELTAPVPEPHPAQLKTVGDAVLAAEKRKHALAVCNSQLDQLRSE